MIFCWYLWYILNFSTVKLTTFTSKRILKSPHLFFLLKQYIILELKSYVFYKISPFYLKNDLSICIWLLNVFQLFRILQLPIDIVSGVGKSLRRLRSSQRLILEVTVHWMMVQHFLHNDETRCRPFFGRNSKIFIFTAWRHECYSVGWVFNTEAHPIPIRSRSRKYWWFHQDKQFWAKECRLFRLN